MIFKGLPPYQIIPFLLLSILGLLVGLWAGLLRLGWALPGLDWLRPDLTARMVMDHGSLMVSGFLGTLIALERVAALRQRWMFAAPLLSGLGWLLALLLPSGGPGMLLITLGSLATTGILLVMLRREPQVYILTMAVGASSWLVGNLFWLAGWPVYRVIFWWMAFLVLTIAGERLELSRVMGLRRQHYQRFALAAGLFLLGVLAAVWQEQLGARLAGVGLLALCAWLLYYDIAPRNLRRSRRKTAQPGGGMPRFIAWCLLIGYFWLGLSGLLILLYGAQSAGFLYDAILHAVFVGFVFSMIFGHALIIFPALTGLAIRYQPGFYLPLVLLHLSLVARVAGDLAGNLALRRWGGLVNEVAILVFMGLMVTSAIQARRAAKRAQAAGGAAVALPKTQAERQGEA